VLTVVDIVAAPDTDAATEPNTGGPDTSATAAAEVCRVAAAAEQGSEHPIARAVLAVGPDTLPPLEDFTALPGAGVRAVIEGREVWVGTPTLLAAHGMPLTGALLAAAAAGEAEGRTAIGVAWDGSARGVLTLADTLKPTSLAAVQELRALGLTPVLLTGDNRRAAATVADQLGIERVHAEVLPEQKAAVVQALQAEGRVVAMVGDGVNDAAALAVADLGLAMGTGTDVAIEASDLTLMRGDLHQAADAIRLSRRTLAIIKQNLVWAFAYNVAALPLAAAGLLNPMLAGAAMACSSVFVVTNSLRLRSFRSATPNGPDLRSNFHS
ncbi:MAG: HAD-IC family P-type ATPase, partial [Nocardioides sp.]